jgi:hypothetical protein
VARAEPRVRAAVHPHDLAEPGLALGNAAANAARAAPARSMRVAAS